MVEKKIDKKKREYQKPELKNLGAMIRITAGVGNSSTDNIGKTEPI